MLQYREYHVAVLGGGLAGLALAIQLSMSGHSVILFEKERYPFHKVCGEYISLECRDFLSALGINITKMDLPVISKLEVSAPNGKLLRHQLPLGGIGISRYLLDQQMSILAKDAGAVLLENCKVENVSFAGETFQIETTLGSYNAKVACGCFGKRSNLDVKWQRPFIVAKKNKLNNYIGVKYHIETSFPADTIALHNFENGYCGIVRIEGGKYNLCYLTKASNLQRCGNSISAMEMEVLCKNPHLAKIFSGSRFLFANPLAISQVSFDPKMQVEQHVLMIGDAAGMITPLCGNGMSMALHASKLAATHIQLFLERRINRMQLESMYTSAWRSQFSSRLRMGRRFQQVFGSPFAINAMIGIARSLPAIVDPLIRRTHGKPF